MHYLVVNLSIEKTNFSSPCSYFHQAVPLKKKFGAKVKTCCSGHCYSFTNHCEVNRGHREGGLLGLAKKFQTPFLKDIENSFHEVTHLGLEPHQFFSF